MRTEQTAKGNGYEAVEYVDPLPGRKGDEVVWETCGRCGGDGVVHYGRVAWQQRVPAGWWAPGSKAAVVGDRWCFECNGKGQTSRKVSSVRAAERRRVKAENQRRADAADWEAERPAREAAERAEREAAEAAEAARLAAQPKGYLAEGGEKVEFEGTVKMIRFFESSDYFGRPSHNALMIFESEGKLAKWVTDWAHELEEGQRVTVKGTVKAHGEYDGAEQTVLTRCKVK